MILVLLVSSTILQLMLLLLLPLLLFCRYLNTQTASATTQRVLSSAQVDPPTLAIVAKGLDMAKLVGLIALLLGLGLVVALFLAEALDAARRGGRCGGGRCKGGNERERRRG